MQTQPQGTDSFTSTDYTNDVPPVNTNGNTYCNADAEEKYWKENFRKQPYYEDLYTFEDYGPAYRSGYSAKSSGLHRTFEEAEAKLERTWDDIKDRSALT